MSRSRIRLGHALVALALIAAIAPAVAQEEPAGRFGERIQVTEVLLDVLVTDDDGNPVVGLAPSDFIVEEEGQQVDVVSATFYGGQNLLASPALAERLEPAGARSLRDRYFILLFEDLRRGSSSLLREHREAALRAQRWVANELGDNDWVAVASYYAKLRIHQDFTRDRDRISAALEEVRRGIDPGATWEADAQLGDAPSLTRYLPQGKELRKRTTRVLDALKLLGEAASNTRGRKNLIFFSIGFGEVDRFGWRPDQRYFPRAREALNDGNVAVYALSLVGGRAGRSASLEALGLSLSQLANDTGGRYFQSFASFAAPLRQVSEDNGGYYLLSYSTEYAAGDSGYRQVKVRAANPNLRVRARDGYLFGG